MTSAPRWESFAEALIARLDALRAVYDDVLRRSTIVHINWNQPGDFAVVIAPDRRWGDDPELEGERARLLADYNDALDLVRLVHRDALPGRRQRLDDADDDLRRWLVRKPDISDWSIPTSVSEAQTLAAQRFDLLRTLLTDATMGSVGVLAVPDTNVLLGDPDVAVYTDVLGTNAYTVVLVPTVLGELDDLKDRGRTPEVRDAAERAVKRIKGLRGRGDLRRGVKVEGKITIRAEPRDVRAEAVLGWLDSSVPDDRLLASVLDVQVREPLAHVVLITRDINLQTKAAAVGMPFVEPPKDGKAATGLVS